MPMRRSRPTPKHPLKLLALAGVAALLAGCGWSPGGPVMETPTAIPTLVLQAPATRSAELLTLVAMMPATSTLVVEATETPTPLPTSTETPTPLPEATADAPIAPTDTPTVEATEVPTEVLTDAATVAATEEPTTQATSTATEAATDEPTVAPTEDPSATETATVETPAPAVQTAQEETPSATIESIPTATLAAAAALTETAEVTATEEITATEEVTPTASISLEPDVPALIPADIVSAVRATTITLPLAGAVTAFPLVDGHHMQEGDAAEPTDVRVRLLSPIVEGDLTGDDLDEVVALAEIGVGDRSLVYLLAFANAVDDNGAPSLNQVARVLVGADVRVSAPVIEDRIVRLEVAQWQSDSPLCCAVRRQQFGYALTEDALAMVESDDLALQNGDVTVNLQPLMPNAVATAQARQPDSQREATVAGTAEIGAINLYTVTVASGDTLRVDAKSEALPVRLIVTSADEPVMWRDGSAAFPLEVTLPATQTIWIGIQGIEMAVPYTLTVTLAPPLRQDNQ